jgi:hypothetical protein
MDSSNIVEVDNRVESDSSIVGADNRAEPDKADSSIVGADNRAAVDSRAVAVLADHPADNSQSMDCNTNHPFHHNDGHNDSHYDDHNHRVEVVGIHAPTSLSNHLSKILPLEE